MLLRWLVSVCVLCVGIVSVGVGSVCSDTGVVVDTDRIIFCVSRCASSTVANRVTAVKFKTRAEIGARSPRRSEHVSRALVTECDKPNALGVSRVLEVDTNGGLYVSGPYNDRLPLVEKEIVLTFDDGPLPKNTNRVLGALDYECTKATFFIVGEMAKSFPGTLRRIALSGHTIGYHTMTHPRNITEKSFDWAKKDISDGWKIVDKILYGMAGDKPVNSFFRYPSLVNSSRINSWLGDINVGVFSLDAVGNDWHRGYLSVAAAPKVVEKTLASIEASKGGILLLHDIKSSSAHALPEILRRLKVRGYRVVHIVPKRSLPPVVGVLGS